MSTQSSRTNERKLDHIRIVREDHQVDRRMGWFDSIRLRHRALPELDLAEVNSETVLFGKSLSFPLIISSMTGGDHDLVRRINTNLAQAAEATRTAFAVGSQRVQFTHPAAVESFAVRKHAPTTVLISNLGAVQLNYGFGADECRQAIEVVGADALAFHLNPLQEAVQPEGNTNFRGLASKLSAVAQALKEPIILKEIGSGLSRADVELVVDKGIHYFDVAGSGGTSWSRIEHHRRSTAKPDETLRHGTQDGIGLTFQDWGIPTPRALELLRPLRERASFIASGGVRTGLDMVKAMALGASFCGIAAPLLGPAMESTEAVVLEIERLRQEFRVGMFLVGAGNIKALVGNDHLVEWNPFAEVR